jgi:micrococcal nuclease
VQEEREGRVQLLLAARRVKRTLVLALLAGVLSAGAATLSGPFSGRVVGVTDGDSVVVLKEERERIAIRLDGIDCPELGQDFGRRAKQFTSDLLLGRTAEIEPKTLDRYGRTVARVQVEGRDASVEIVRAGYAWHFLRYSSDPVLDAAERSARTGRLGLWLQSDAVAPWEFRAGRAPTPAGAAAFHGNSSSHVFHRSECRNYGCDYCTKSFNTREEALSAGFSPAGCCRP